MTYVDGSSEGDSFKPKPLILNQSKKNDNNMSGSCHYLDTTTPETFVYHHPFTPCPQKSGGKVN